MPASSQPRWIPPEPGCCASAFAPQTPHAETTLCLDLSVVSVHVTLHLDAPLAALGTPRVLAITGARQRRRQVSPLHRREVPAPQCRAIVSKPTAIQLLVSSRSERASLRDAERHTGRHGLAVSDNVRRVVRAFLEINLVGKAAAWPWPSARHHLGLGDLLLSPNHVTLHKKPNGEAAKNPAKDVKVIHFNRQRRVVSQTNPLDNLSNRVPLHVIVNFGRHVTR